MGALRIRRRVGRTAAFAGLLVVSVLSPVGTIAPVDAEPSEGASVAAADDQRLVSVGGLHTCAVLDTGEVQCWGANDNGQIGNGTTATSTVPRKVSGITTAIGVSAGATHTCALLHDGTVRCWGNNGSGQLGIGRTSPPDPPVLSPVVVQFDHDADPATPTVPLDGVTSIAAGGFHNCAIRSGGAVVCWGHDGSGQLGDGGGTTAEYLPVAVEHDHDGNVFTPAVAIGGVTAIAAGEYHTCGVIGATGAVKCWGANGSGQLGNGVTLPGVDRTIAVAVTGIPEDHGHPGDHAPHKAIAITAGQAHTCALLHGTALEGSYARCWGNGFFGQLGNNSHGTGADVSTPQRVEFDADPNVLVEDPQDLNGLVVITAGQFHTCGRTAGNAVRCWGQNGRGQLGDNTTTDADMAVTVPGLSAVRAVTAGGFHTCALVSTGVQCWGYNFYGQLGAYRTQSAVPVTVTALQGATRATTGDGHACALVDVPDGTPPDPACWGNNANGELGALLVPSPANSTTPVDVHGAADAALLSAGNGHTCLLPSGAGAGECWGRNSQGQLGNGSNTSTDAPVAVSTLTGITQLSAGGALVGGTEVGHTCARVSGGGAYCWGENGSRQLGDETTTDRDEPVKVRSDHDDDHLNTPDPPITPPQDLTDAVEVAAGGSHSCARLGSGRVRCWGENGSGQLGDGTTTPRPYAVTVDRDDEEPEEDESDLHFDPLDKVFAVAAGGSHSCALRNPDATPIDEVWCWGENGDGQLGDGSTAPRDVPVKVTLGAFLSPLEITAGDRHTCIRTINTSTNNTFAQCWGSDDHGQIGDTGSGDKTTPVAPKGLAEIDDDDPVTGVDLVTSISAGRWNTCATLIDTTVSCWGLNQFGQLGDGVGSYWPSPLPVQNLASVGGNHIPAPVADTATIAVPPPPAVGITIDVLANDADADGDTLSVSAVTDAPRGTVVNNGADVTYTPDADFCSSDPTSKTDTFTYWASDGTASVPGTVTVTVECPNTAPDAVDDSATTAEESAVSIAVVGNDSDINGDAVTVASVGVPAHGTAVIAGGGTSITYTPAADFFGADTFTYTAKDPLGAESTPAIVSVTVTNVNDAPVAGDDVASTNEDTAVTIDVVGNDTDIDGPSLAVASVGGPAHGTAVATTPTEVKYTPAPGFCGSDGFSYVVSDGGATDTATVTVSVTCVNDGPNAVDDSAVTNEDVAVTVDVLGNDTDPEGDTLTISAVSDPAHGTTTNNGTNVTYTPDANFCGADDFGYTVSDGTATDTAVVVPVTVICHNDSPVASDDSVSAPEDGVTGVAVLDNDTDVDFNTLSVASVTDPGHGTATIGSSNVVSYAPDADYCGTDTFTYTATDSYGGTDTATVNVSVVCVDDAPAVGAVSDATTPWGEALSIPLGATDADAGDGDPATSETVAFSLVDGPAGAALVEGPPGTFTFTWTPTDGQLGSFLAVVRGTDGTGRSDEESFAVTVTKRATSVTYTGTPSGQYSDPAAVSALLVDFEGSPLAGKGVAFTIGSTSTAALTGAGGTAGASIVVDDAAGAASVLTNFHGDAAYFASSSTMPFTVLKEAATATFVGRHLTTTAGTSAPVQLQAKVADDPDGSPGSSLASVQVTFTQVGGGTLCSSPVSLDGIAGSGTASCSTPNLALGSRGVVVKITSAKYTAMADVAAFAVAQAPSGSASGAGRVVGGGADDAFAFQARPVRKAAPSGDALHVRRAGGVAYVNHATTLSSLTTGCSGGKAKTCTAAVEAASTARWHVDLGTGAATPLAGSSSLRIDAVDVTEPDGTGVDRYAVALGAPDAYSLGSTATPVVITAGNVRVPA
jgi:alpha-tubulin suppressor-like RCC1 family protein